MDFRESATHTMSTPTLDLARLRQLAGCSLEEIAANTKISMRFLRAIEREEFEQLPGGIFSTSYLRQYAAAIGYDEGELIAHYHVKMKLPGANGTETPRKDAGRNRLDRWLKAPAQAIRQP
jgi:cytoskeletal protein RodZ